MADRSASIRNLALVGHGDAGKTTFAEHALLAGKAIKRAGSVPDGSTVCDWDVDERERCHSIDATPCRVAWQGTTVNIVDCPGYPDFSGGAIVGLWAMDTAVLFVNAAGGMGVNTRRMWHAAERLGKARMVVISRCDADTADPEVVLAAVQKVLGAKCLPVNLPDGRAGSFKSVVSCFGSTAEGSPLFGDVQMAHSELVEAIVETDDDLLERFLEGEELTDAELAEGLKGAIMGRLIVPVLFTAAAQNVGVTEFLDFVAAYAPSAATPVGAKALTRRSADATVIGTSDGPFLASVFKITSDVHVGKQCFLRVWRGSLPASGVVWNSAGGGAVKIAHPTRPQGKDFEPVSSVGPGDVFCIAKIDELKLCASVADESTKATVVSPPFRKSMVAVAVTARTRGEDHKISAALDRIAEEDPSFSAERSHETNELVIAGRSSLHLDIVLKRVKRRFKLEMDTHVPRVPLKETVTAKSPGHHRHKKQTGGRGQFGEVYLRIAPQERGAGFEFADKTVGGSVPKNFMPAIEKGIREIMQKGVMAGYRVVDVRVEVYDGKHHPVDSSEAAFKVAGARAFRNAFDKARPVLLEPIMDVEIDVPSRYLGDITGDLNTRRGRISGMDSHDDHQVIKAKVPLSEVQTYSTDLRSMTSGEGSYNLEPSHLDVVPQHIASKLMATYAKLAKGEE